MGKSWLACALGHKACREGSSALYKRVPRLLAAIERTRRLSTSQVPVSRWHEIIGDMTLGDAILDRVVHRAHRLEPKGASLRKRRTTPDSSTADASK